MPKHKQMLHAGKQKGRQAAKGPETADDFLAAGVDYEEAGEKWRAGDVAKSSRFFSRAIDSYNVGLQSFPDSFDLVYNKARLQYDLSQQPRLLPHLDASFFELLQSSLESHRLALTLSPEDTDTIFNTAQVLTSLGEFLSGGSKSSEINKAHALRAFQEAFGLFQKCLIIQESLYSQAKQQEAGFVPDLVPLPSEPSRTESPVSEASEEERWAFVVKPTTKGTLVDTVIAQIETLISLCDLTITQDPNALSKIEEYSMGLLKNAVDYSTDTEREFEVILARANFLSSYFDASFRTGRIDLPTYEQELDAAFGPDLDLSRSVQGLCDRADAFISFNTSIYAIFNLTNLAPTGLSQLNDIRWKRLTKALDDLTAASKLPEADGLPKIHIRRGDCELLRHRLGEEPASYEPARKYAATLLKNAETYYRGARRVAEADMATEEALEAKVKEAMLKQRRGEGGELSDLAASNAVDVISIMQDMRDEFLICEHELAMISF